MKVYVAMQNSDLTEGRGGEVPIGYFLNREVAEYINSKAPGVFGSKNNRKVKEIDVCEAQNLQEYRKYTDKMRMIALNKLTTEERELLGL